MARVKNAITKYEVAPLPTDGVTEPAYVELAKWLTEVNNASEDQVEESAYYDGDGTIEETITGIKEKYEFVGTYDPEDAGMKFIADLKDKDGDARKVMLRVTDPDGATETGLATVSNIIARGGVASDFPAFNCTITRSEKAEKAPAA